MSKYLSGTPNRPKGILELGAGTALPSILLTKAATDSFVIITDRPDVPQILINVQEALKENGIRTLYPNDPSAKVLVRSLNWGDFTFKGKGDDDVGGLLQLLDDVCLQQIDSNNNDSKAPLEHIDIILGSDVFYNPQATVSYIINQHNPDCVFLTTYQNRSAKRNIDHLLRKWGLEGREINWEDFDFNMSKFIGDDESDDGGGHESGESGHESNDDEGTNNEDRINDMDWDPSIKFERKESKLETVAQSSTKVSKVPLVDYRSSSEEEEEEEEVERERDEIDENQKEDRRMFHVYHVSTNQQRFILIGLAV
ncbi:Methyltransferase-like protein 23 [Entomortierella beljakovae]|nr:Methyltransferase-like protein 23 [Entomortierella beljakovae]